MYKKLVCLLLMFTMVIGGFTSNGVVMATSIDDLEDKIEDIQNKNKEITNNMNSIGGDIKREAEKQTLLNEQITNADAQIVLYNEKIQLLEQNIVDKSAEIVVKNDEIVTTEDLFLQRVRASYISGTSSYLDLLFSSTSFSDLLAKSEIIKRISMSDRDLMDELTEQKNELADQHLDLEKQNEDLAYTKEELAQTMESITR